MIKQKLTLILSLVVLAGLTVVVAQQIAFNNPTVKPHNLTVKKTPKASFKWQKTQYSFGKIPQNKPAKATFSFVNEGNEPLIITHAVGSCGCTVADYPKNTYYARQKKVK